VRRLIHLLIGLGFASIVAADGAIEKVILVLNTGGHTAKPEQVLFTPDGKKLISVSLDKSIRIWDVDSGESLSVIRPPIGQGLGGGLYAAAMSPDGRMLAVGGLAYNIAKSIRAPIYVITTTGRMIRGHDGHRLAVAAIARSPDGKQIASASADHTTRVWNVAEGRRELVLSRKVLFAFQTVSSEKHSMSVISKSATHEGTRGQRGTRFFRYPTWTRLSCDFVVYC
jgi:WD40 repeat protein